MKKNKLNNIAGLTLIEILIGVVISTMMMAAMYTTYITNLKMKCLISEWHRTMKTREKTIPDFPIASLSH